MSTKQISFNNKESWKDTLKSRDSQPSPHLNIWGNNYKTNYVKPEIDNKETYSFGIDNNRVIMENGMRKSPFGLVPTIIDNKNGGLYLHNDMVHSFSHTHDYNLKRHQKY